MVACAIFRPLTYVPLVLLRSVTMKRPSRKSRRAWCLETLPFGNMRSLPWTRPTLISLLSKASLRSAPPFSLMIIENISSWSLETAAHLDGGGAAPLEDFQRDPGFCCEILHRAPFCRGIVGGGRAMCQSL